jgi:Zn-dependent protease
MFHSWKLGRLAGIDLYLHPTFLLLLAFAFAFEGGALAVAFVSAVFACVVLHEYGHALTARAYGIRTHDITLYPIGGVARLERLPRKPGPELLVTLAGPAVNVAIAATLAAVLAVGGWMNPGGELTLLGQFLRTLMMVNVALAVFNLLPAFPMDGGRVLRALLTAPLGRLRATEVAVAVGRVLAVALPLTMMALGIFTIFHVILAAFVFLAAGTELRQVRAEERWAWSRRPFAAREPGSEGIWTAPNGYRWVRLGRNTWRLAPVAVHAGAWPHRGGNASWTPRG